MKIPSLSALLLIVSFFIDVHCTVAQDYIPVFTRDYRSRLSVEIDAIAYVLRGHSLHVRYQPMFSERFLIGAGTYALDMPEVFVGFNKRNRDQGWNVRIRSAYFLCGEFYPTEANNGWFIGEQAGFRSYRVSNVREASGRATFNTFVLMTYVGYSWRPYKGSFYIKPWAGLGYTGKVDGLNTLGNMRYEIGPLTGFLTVHFGYSF